MTRHIHIHVGGKTKDAELKYKTQSDFPHMIKYKGMTLVATGKKGTHNRTGQLSQEYATEERVWMRQDGTVEPD